MNVSSLDGGTFDAYVAQPATTPATAVVILQEIFGVNRAVRRIADRFAERGYLALAPDLFWRFAPNIELSYRPEDLERAFDYLKRLDEKLALDDIEATVRAARGLPECNGTVVVAGFCLGGQLAYRAASHCSIDAASGFYGVGIDRTLDEASRLRCPLQLHFGGKDTYIPPPVVSAISTALAGVPQTEIFVYPEADHGFFNEKRPDYDAALADLAMSRTIALFDRARRA
jgi:carboxymethylenebutenolidase